MPKKKVKQGNLKLAGIFIAVVLGLIFLSFTVKLAFVIKGSKFDGNHKFNVLFKGNNEEDIVSFSPNPRSISILKIVNPSTDLANTIAVPIDGTIKVKGDLNISDLLTILFKSEFPMGNKVGNLTFLDLFRLALFSRTVSSNTTYLREFSSNFSNAQKNTIISLTFTDPSVYEENQSIEIINATTVNGLGAKFALFITNIGGNPILISNSDNQESKSKIIYFGEESYTVKRLSAYFNIPKEKASQRGIADVIIVLGKDIIGKPGF
jgi:hypothetical protein